MDHPSQKSVKVSIQIDPAFRKEVAQSARRESESINFDHRVIDRSHTIHNCHGVRETAVNKIFANKMMETAVELEAEEEKCCMWSNKKIAENGIYNKTIHQRDGKYARIVGKLVDSTGWTITSSAATIISLFLRDMVLMTMPKSYDAVALDGFLTLCVIYFTLELILATIAKENFFGSFFFTLDVVGTVSLILDVPWIQDSIKSALGIDIALLTVAKGGRMGRAARSAGISKMTTRFIRMVRMLRVVRTARCFSKEHMSEDLENTENSRPSRVGVYLADSITKKIILIVLIMLISVSMMGTSPVDPNLSIANTSLVTLELMEMNDAYWANFSDIIQDNAWSKGFWFGKPFMKLEEVKVNDHVIMNGTTVLATRRPLEVLDVETESGNSHCTFDQNILIKEESAWNIVLMVFVIVMFCFGSYIISSKANMLVVKPIEKMVDVVKSLTASLIHIDDDTDTEEKLETDILQDVMKKIGMIFHTRPMEEGFNRKVFKTHKKELVVTVVERARKSIFPAAQRMLHSAFSFPRSASRDSRDSEGENDNHDSKRRKYI